MLRIIKIEFKIGLNKLVIIKTKNGIILLNLIIFLEIIKNFYAHYLNKL